MINDIWKPAQKLCHVQIPFELILINIEIETHCYVSHTYTNIKQLYLVHT
jgi:hypothetical protein